MNRCSSTVIAALLALSVSAVPAHGQSDEAGASPRADATVLQPGDVLRVQVWPEQDLSGEFMVEESGYVYLPYLQEVQAAGVSIDELRAELRDGYRQMMQNPVVTVTPVFQVTVRPISSNA